MEVLLSRSVQFNIRTDPSVAQAVRARARARGISLGKALAELVEAGRAWSGEGIVLRPDPALARALDALAAAEATSPAKLLESALRGDLRARLIRLADGLGPTVAAPAQLASADSEPAPAEPQDDIDDEDVGLFTVFD
jgi:predicted HicB family RNase H-like nuclease